MRSVIQLILLSLIFNVKHVSTQNQYSRTITCYTKFEHEEIRHQENGMVLGGTYENMASTQEITPDREKCSEVGCTCFSYKGTCTRPSRGSNHYSQCTQEDISAAKIRWHRGWTSIAKCQKMFEEPQTYQELACCQTDKCNNQIEKVTVYLGSQTTITPLNLHHQNHQHQEQHHQEQHHHHQHHHQQQNHHQQQHHHQHQEQHPSPQQYHHDVQESNTFRSPEPYVIPDWHRNHNSDLITSRLPDPSELLNWDSKHHQHSTTTRLSETRKPSSHYTRRTSTLTTTHLPVTVQQNKTKQKSLPENKAFLSSSFSTLIILFSLVFSFYFF